MTRYRLTHAAQEDIESILGWSHEQFGAEVRQRYEALIVAAIRDAADADVGGGGISRPELGEGVFVWHLARSRTHGTGARVRRPRHFLVCRRDGDVLVVGRVLHEAMDLQRHIDSRRTWGDDGPGRRTSLD